MAKYSIGSVAKALVAGGIAAVGALGVAAGGVDLASLDIAQWLGALGAGLVAAAGTFGVPNKGSKPADDPVIDVATGAINVVEDLIETKENVENQLDKLRDAVGAGAGQIPVLGSLAQQVINSIKLPKL